MPLNVSGAYVIADSRKIQFTDFEVHRNTDGWSALTRFTVADQDGQTLEIRKRHFNGSTMNAIRNQIFQADAVDKIYQDFIDNTEFNVPVTGVSNEWVNP
jgi:hypothetical protein